MNKFDTASSRHSIRFVSFQELINQSSGVIGLAGTANEQCIGCGLPVFCFPGTGPQTTVKRFLQQRQLLMNLPEFYETFDSVIIAKRIQQRMKDQEWRKWIAEQGPRVMGPPGAAKNMVKEIACILESSNM